MAPDSHFDDLDDLDIFKNDTEIETTSPGSESLLKRLRLLDPMLAARPEGVDTPHLVFRLGQHVCFVPIDGLLRLGREDEKSAGEVELAIPNPSLSRKHVEIREQEDGIQLKDLGSRNGTKVNGMSVGDNWLVSGDHIEAGGMDFFFVVDGMPDFDLDD